MPSTDDTTASQKPEKKSRPERTHVLPVAQIYAVKGAERHALEVIVTTIVGDERNPPKRHGLRAPLPLWVELVTALAAEDPVLRERIETALRELPRA